MEEPEWKKLPGWLMFDMQGVLERAGLFVRRDFEDHVHFFRGSDEFQHLEEKHRRLLNVAIARIREARKFGPKIESLMQQARKSLKEDAPIENFGLVDLSQLHVSERFIIHRIFKRLEEKNLGAFSAQLRAIKRDLEFREKLSEHYQQDVLDMLIQVAATLAPPPPPNNQPDAHLRFVSTAKSILVDVDKFEEDPIPVYDLKPIIEQSKTFMRLHYTLQWGVMKHLDEAKKNKKTFDKHDLRVQCVNFMESETFAGLPKADRGLMHRKMNAVLKEKGFEEIPIVDSLELDLKKKNTLNRVTPSRGF